MSVTTADFSKRLDQTAEDTEALLTKLLADAPLPDEIARTKRLIEAMRYSSLGGENGCGRFWWSRPPPCSRHRAARR